MLLCPINSTGLEKSKRLGVRIEPIARISTDCSLRNPSDPLHR